MNVTFNYSCRPALNSLARELAEMYDYNYSAMTTAEIKDYVITNIADYSYFFNPGVDVTNQTYIYRSFFDAGIPSYTYIIYCFT